MPELNCYSSRGNWTTSGGKWGFCKYFYCFIILELKVHAWACDLREISSRKLKVYFPVSVSLHRLCSVAFSDCIWHQWRCNVVIYCISGAITFSGRNSVKGSRESRKFPMHEISKTLLNSEWFPETCNRDSCWPGSAAEERGTWNLHLGSNLEVRTWDFLHAAKPKSLLQEEDCVVLPCDGCTKEQQGT